MNKIQLNNSTLQSFEAKTIIEKLTVSETHIVTASKEQLIGTMTTNQLNVLAAKTIMTAKTRLGLRESAGDELKAEISVIADDLRGFRGLSGTEIHMALKSGLDGDFSQDGKVFFSSSTFVIWIKKWIAEKKQPAMKKYALLLHEAEKTKPPPTLEEEKRLCANVANMYADFKRKDPEYEVQSAFSLYDDITRFGIWELSKSDKQEIFKKAQVKFKNSTKEQLVHHCKNEGYNLFISHLVDNNFNVSQDGNLTKSK